MSGECQYIIRPARADDVRFLYGLGERAGPGFTSLQPDMHFLSGLIAKSEDSFGQATPDRSQTFLLVMQSLATCEVVGCASVKTNVGMDDFMCADFELDGDNAPAAGAAACASRMVLRRTLKGHTEVGSLFLHPDHRASGAGRFLARARYMLMGTSGSVFEAPIVAQLRGWCGPNARSPFYDAVWKDRLSASYEQSDARLAREGAGYILEAFSGLELDLGELTPEAIQAIGRPHDTAAGALKLLEQEGFIRSNLVDLADGGPILMATRDTLPSLLSARVAGLQVGTPDPSGSIGMICSDSLEQFQALVGRFDDSGDEITCPSWMHEAFDAADHSRLIVSGPGTSKMKDFAA